ncbi:MAG: DNA glycosylase [Eubacteriales bacterium]|nr:DNA glycosylase [Eubacteriales bacterium]
MTHPNTWTALPMQGEFSTAQTLDCGQCFRWTPQEDGSWLGLVGQTPARVRDENGTLWIQTPSGLDSLWMDYFDCALDYTAIRTAFAIDEFTSAAADYGRGIRILRQDPWEALCSFLISQCNNIPRIRGILSRLCEALGEPMEFQGQTLYTFPKPEHLAPLERADLEFLRAGYRAPYLIHAARAVCDGSLDFSSLENQDTETARQQIMQLRGVGRKVADCFLLFGMHKLDAFPVDTWMKKAAGYYSGDFSVFRNSPYAGIYQQYIFYYIRSVLS